MADRDKGKVNVIGAGLGGALMAVYLGQAGYEVNVFERRPDPRKAGVAGGRSINLALSLRGIHALHEVGLADRVLEMAIPMRGRMIHAPTGDLSFQPYSKNENEAINSVSRGGLNLALVEAAEQMPNVAVHFDHRCTAVDLADGTATLSRGDDSTTNAAGRLLIGADGAFSAVRAAMQRTERFNYSQDYLAHGYKELCIPPADDGSHRIEKNALHIWPRQSFMMIALPNLDGSFTCTLFWPFEGPSSFAAIKSDTDLLRFFEQQFPDALPHMPTLCADYNENPTSSLVTVRCDPWTIGDRVTLLGDACHAVVPFYGQGMNCAFEDCTALADCLKRSAGDISAAIHDYGRSRVEHANALADLAIENFIEMRDHTGSQLFRWKKKTEQTLHKLLPGWYAPLYSMVTFSRIPYADAVRRAKRQDRIVKRAAIAAAGLLVIVLLVILWAVLK